MLKIIFAKSYHKSNILNICTSFTTTNDDFCLMELENLVCGDDVISADMLPVKTKSRPIQLMNHIFNLLFFWTSAECCLTSRSYPMKHFLSDNELCEASISGHQPSAISSSFINQSPPMLLIRLNTHNTQNTDRVF